MDGDPQAQAEVGGASSSTDPGGASSSANPDSVKPATGGTPAPLESVPEGEQYLKSTPREDSTPAIPLDSKGSLEATSHPENPDEAEKNAAPKDSHKADESKADTKSSGSKSKKSEEVQEIGLIDVGGGFLVYLPGKSLKIFHANNPVRRACARIGSDKKFDNFILFLIFVNSIILMIVAWQGEELEKSDGMVAGEYVFALFFLGEFLIKIIWMGFVCGTETYLHNPWNILDFIVLLGMYFEIILALAGASGGASGSLSLLRLFRLFRPLKSLNAIPGVKRIVMTLFHSLNKLGEIIALMVFVLSLFAILGMNIFPEVLWNRCRSTPEPLPDGSWPLAFEDLDEDRFCGGHYECPPPTICGNLLHAFQEGKSTEEKLWEELESCGNADYGLTGFRNFGTALLTAFQLSTLEGWTDHMYKYQDGSSMVVGTIYMLLIVILGGIFLLNLVTAILWEAFGEEGSDEQKDSEEEKKEEDTGSAVANLTPAELEKLEKEKAQKALAAERLAVTVANRLADYRSLDSLVKACEKYALQLAEEEQKQDAMFDSADEEAPMLPEEKTSAALSTRSSWCPGSHRYKPLRKMLATDRFQFAICGLIVLNTVILACEQYPPPPVWVQEIFEKLNIIFTLIFTVELIVKLLAYTPKTFVADKSNVFDAIVVVLSLVELTLSSGSALSGARVWRLFRIMRVFKIARSWIPMRILLEVIVKAVVAILDFCFVTILVLFIFTLSGMMFFARTLGDTFEERPRLNFDDPLWAFMSVFACLTGENWNATMIDTSFQSKKIFVGITYFLVLVFVGNIVLLQLFLAILASSFFTAREEMEVVYRARLQKYMTERPDLMGSPTKSHVDDDLFALTKEAQEGAQEDEKVERREMLEEGTSFFEDDPQSGPELTKDLTAELEPSVVGSDQPPGTHRTGNNSDQPPGTNRSGVEESPLDTQRTPGEDPADNPSGENKTPEQAHAVVSHHESMDSMESMDNVEPPHDGKDENVAHDGNAQKKEEVNNYSALFQSSVTMKKAFVDLFAAEEYSQSQIDKSNELAWWRRKIFFVVESKRFETMIVGWIIISSIFLAADEGDYVDPDGGYRAFLNVLDIILSVVFTFEMIFRIMAYGFKAYYQSGWNMMDGFVVCMSWISLFGWKPARVARTLRPLRLITHHPGLMLVADSLLKAIPLLGNTLIFSIVLWFVLAIMGVSFFKGTMYHCGYPHMIPPIVIDGDGRDYYAAVEEVAHRRIGRDIVTPLDCQESGGVWMNADANFDNVFKAMITLFQVSTTEGWTDVMFRAVDGAGVNQQPIPNANLFGVVYFLAAMVVLFLFITNLFVGVILDQYAATKSDLEGGQGKPLMTPEQQGWVSIQKQWLTQEPQAPKSKEAQLAELKSGKFLNLRRACLSLILSSWFDTVILVCILINIGFMCTKHVGESESWTEIQAAVNLVFSLVFNVEMIVKLIPLGFRKYFKDRFNIFDFVVVWITNVTMILAAAGAMDSGGSVAPVARAIRITRVLRLLRNEKAKTLRILFYTLFTALPSVCNIAGLLILLMFIYACVGSALFGTVAYGGALHENANFGSFINAFLLCLRMATGESWHLLMYDCVNEQIGCSRDQTYEDLQEFGPNGCGNAAAAYVYFISFQLVVTWIMFNLFVGAIVDAFVDQKNADRIEDIRQQQTELYAALEERKSDGMHHVRFLSVEDTIEILMKVEPPVGFKGVFAGSPAKQKKLVLQELAYGGAEMRLYGDHSDLSIRRLHWVDVVLNSCKRSLHAFENEDNWVEQKDATKVQLDHRLCKKFMKRFPELTAVLHEGRKKHKHHHHRHRLVPLGKGGEMYTISHHRAVSVITEWFTRYKTWKEMHTAPVQVSAKVKFTIENVDYSKLSAAGKDSLTSGLKSTIAKTAGVDDQHVAVSLSPGSVKVDADIVQETTLSEAHARCQNMKDGLSKPDLTNNVLASARAIPEVVAASDGEIAVTEPVVEAAEPPPPPTAFSHFAAQAFVGQAQEAQEKNFEQEQENKDKGFMDTMTGCLGISPSHTPRTSPRSDGGDAKAPDGVKSSDVTLDEARRKGEVSDHSEIAELRLSEEALRGLHKDKEKSPHADTNGHSEQGLATTVLGTDGDESQIGPWDSVSQIGAQRPADAPHSPSPQQRKIHQGLNRVESDADDDDFTWLNDDEETQNLRQMCTNMSTVGYKSNLSNSGTGLSRDKSPSKVGTSVAGQQAPSSATMEVPKAHKHDAPAAQHKEEKKETHEPAKTEPKKIEPPKQKKRDEGCGDCTSKDKDVTPRGDAHKRPDTGKKKSSICGGGDSDADSSRSADSKSTKQSL